MIVVVVGPSRVPVAGVKLAKNFGIPSGDAATLGTGIEDWHTIDRNTQWAIDYRCR